MGQSPPKTHSEPEARTYCKTTNAVTTEPTLFHKPSAARLWLAGCLAGVRCRRLAGDLAGRPTGPVRIQAERKLAPAHARAKRAPFRPHSPVCANYPRHRYPPKRVPTAPCRCPAPSARHARHTLRAFGACNSSAVDLALPPLLVSRAMDHQLDLRLRVHAHACCVAAAFLLLLLLFLPRNGVCVDGDLVDLDVRLGPVLAGWTHSGATKMGGSTTMAALWQRRDVMM